RFGRITESPKRLEQREADFRLSRHLVHAKARAPKKCAIRLSRRPQLAHALALELRNPRLEHRSTFLRCPGFAAHAVIPGNLGIAMQPHQIVELVAPPAAEHQPVGLKYVEIAHVGGVTVGVERSSRGRLKTMVSRPAPCAPTSIANRSAKASIT